MKNILTENNIPENETVTKPQYDKINLYGLEKPVFGEYTPKKSNSSVQQSTLNLNIVGIIASESIKDSQVILKMNNGKDEIFKVGDKLAEDVLITDIKSECILVQRNDAIESLNFPSEKLTFLEPSKALLDEE